MALPKGEARIVEAIGAATRIIGALRGGRPQHEARSGGAERGSRDEEAPEGIATSPDGDNKLGVGTPTPT